MKRTLNSSAPISAVPFGINLLRLGGVGGAIQRRLSPIRWTASGSVKHCSHCDAQFDDATARCVHCQRKLRGAPATATGSTQPTLALLAERQPIFAAPLLDALTEAEIPFEPVGKGNTHEVNVHRGSSGRRARVAIFVPAEHLERARAVEADLLARTLPDLPEGYDPNSSVGGECPACGHPLPMEAAECADCGLAILSE